MEDREALEMMRRCAEEIRSQRAHIEHLQPQAEAYQVIRDVVRLIPGPLRGATEDIAWRLEKRISEIEARQKADNSPATNMEGG